MKRMIKKIVAIFIVVVHFTVSADIVYSFSYFIPRQYKEDRERSGYFRPDKVLRRMKRRRDAIRQKNKILRMADSYSLSVKKQIDQQQEKNIVDLRNTAQQIQQELAQQRAKRYRIAEQKEGFKYIQYDDGKKVWLKDGLAYQVENEKIIDAQGNVSYRNMYDMQYNKKRLMTSYKADIVDAQGLTTTIVWTDAVYTEKSVFYADEETKAEKNLVSFKEIIIDSQGNVTSRYRSDCQYNENNLLESYTEVRIDTFGNAETTIWSGIYDANDQNIGYHERIIDSFGNETTRTFYGARYKKNEYYDEDDPYERQSEYLITEYHMDIVDANGNTTSVDWFGAKYNKYGLLVEYQENTIDALGIYSGRHWKNGRYDSFGRLSNYYEIRYDTFGNASALTWSNAQYDVYGNILSFEEETVDSLGNTEHRERTGSQYNTKGQLLEYTEITTDIFGNTASFFWQAKEYDSHNRITSYYKEETDTFGNKTITNRSNAAYNNLNQLLSYTEETTDAFGNTTVTGRSNTRYNNKGQVVYYQDKITDRYGAVSRETFKDATYDDYGRLYSYKKELIDPYSKRTIVERTESFYDEFNRLTVYKEEHLDYNGILSKVYWYDASYNDKHLLTNYQVDITKPGSTVSETWSHIRYDEYGRMLTYDLKRDITTFSVQRDYILPDWYIWSSYSKEEQIDLLSGKIIVKGGKEVFLLYEEMEVEEKERVEIQRIDTVYDNYGRVKIYKEKEFIFPGDEKQASQVTFRTRNDVYSTDNELLSYAELERVHFDDGTAKRTLTDWKAEARDKHGRITAYREHQTLTMKNVLDAVILHKETTTVRSGMTYTISGLLAGYTDRITDSSTPGVKTVEVKDIAYNENFQMESLRSKATTRAGDLKRVVITRRYGMQYNPYGQLISYKEKITNPADNITGDIFCFNMIYDPAGKNITSQYQFNVTSGKDRGKTLYHAELKKMTGMKYNHAGALYSWNQEIMTRDKPGQITQSSVAIGFDVEGRQSKYEEHVKLTSTDGQTIYSEYHLIKDNIQYNDMGLAAIWNEERRDSTQPDVVKKSYVIAGYNKKGLMTSYRERGSRVDEKEGLLDESYYLHKTNITYNKLNQAENWDQRSWSSSSEGLEELSNVTVLYNKNGSESYYKQNGIRTGTYGPGYAVEFEITKNHMQYDNRGRSTSWEQTSWQSNAPDLKNTSTITVQYNDNGLQASFREIGTKVSISDTSFKEQTSIIKEDITYNELGQAVAWEQTYTTSASPDITVKNSIHVDYDTQGRQRNYYDDITKVSKDNGESVNIHSFINKTNITYNEYGMTQQYDNEEWNSTTPDVITKTTVSTQYNKSGQVHLYRKEGAQYDNTDNHVIEEVLVVKSNFTYNRLGFDESWQEDRWTSATPELHITTSFTISYDTQGRQSMIDESIHKHGVYEEEEINSVVHSTKENIKYNNFGQMKAYLQTLQDTASPDVHTESIVTLKYDSLGRQALYHETSRQVAGDDNIMSFFEQTKSEFIYDGSGRAVDWHEESWDSSAANIVNVMDARVVYNDHGQFTSFHADLYKTNKADSTVIEHNTQDKTGFTYNGFGQTVGFTSVFFRGDELTINGETVNWTSLSDEEKQRIINGLIDETIEVEELITIHVQENAVYNEFNQLIETDAVPYVRGFTMQGLDGYLSLFEQIDGLQDALDAQRKSLEDARRNASPEEFEILVMKARDALNIGPDEDVLEVINERIAELSETAEETIAEIESVLGELYDAETAMTDAQNNLQIAQGYISLLEAEITQADKDGIEGYNLADDSDLAKALGEYFAAFNAQRAAMTAAREAYQLAVAKAKTAEGERTAEFADINGVELMLGIDELIDLGISIFGSGGDNIAKYYYRCVYADDKGVLHYERRYKETKLIFVDAEAKFEILCDNVVESRIVEWNDVVDLVSDMENSAEISAFYAAFYDKETYRKFESFVKAGKKHQALLTVAEEKKSAYEEASKNLGTAFETYKNEIRIFAEDTKQTLPGLESIWQEKKNEYDDVNGELDQLRITYAGFVDKILPLLTNKYEIVREQDRLQSAEERLAGEIKRLEDLTQKHSHEYRDFVNELVEAVYVFDGKELSLTGDQIDAVFKGENIYIAEIGSDVSADDFKNNVQVKRNLRKNERQRRTGMVYDSKGRLKGYTDFSLGEDGETLTSTTVSDIQYYNFEMIRSSRYDIAQGDISSGSGFPEINDNSWIDNSYSIKNSNMQYSAEGNLIRYRKETVNGEHVVVEETAEDILYDRRGRMIETHLNCRELGPGLNRSYKVNTTGMEYNHLNQLTCRTETMVEGKKVTVTMSTAGNSYDKNGNLLGQHDSVSIYKVQEDGTTGLTETYTQDMTNITYDDFNRRTSYSNITSRGSITSISQVSLAYKTDGQVSSQHEDIVEIGRSDDGETLLARYYTRNAEYIEYNTSRKPSKQRVTTTEAGLSTTEEVTNHYDSKGRVNRVEKTVNEQGIGLTRTYTQVFTVSEFDWFGRALVTQRTTSDDSARPGVETSEVIKNSYNDEGQVEKTHLQVRIDGGDFFQRYESETVYDGYNSLNQTVSATRRTWNDSNAEGKEITENITTEYYLNGLVKSTDVTFTETDLKGQGRLNHTYTVKTEYAAYNSLNQASAVIRTTTNDSAAAGKTTTETIYNTYDIQGRVSGSVTYFSETAGDACNHTYRVEMAVLSRDDHGRESKVETIISMDNAAPAKIVSETSTISYGNDGRRASVSNEISEKGPGLNHTYTQITSYDQYNDLGQVTRSERITKNDSASPEKVKREVIYSSYNEQGKLLTTDNDVWDNSRFYHESYSYNLYDDMGRATGIVLTISRDTNAPDTEIIRDISQEYDENGRILNTTTKITEKEHNEVVHTYTEKIEHTGFNLLGQVVRAKGTISDDSWKQGITVEYTNTADTIYDLHGREIYSDTEYSEKSGVVDYERSYNVEVQISGFDSFGRANQVTRTTSDDSAAPDKTIVEMTQTVYDAAGRARTIERQITESGQGYFRTFHQTEKINSYTTTGKTKELVRRTAGDTAAPGKTVTENLTLSYRDGRIYKENGEVIETGDGLYHQYKTEKVIIAYDKNLGLQTEYTIRTYDDSGGADDTTTHYSNITFNKQGNISSMDMKEDDEPVISHYDIQYNSLGFRLSYLEMDHSEADNISELIKTVWAEYEAEVASLEEAIRKTRQEYDAQIKELEEGLAQYLADNHITIESLKKMAETLENLDINAYSGGLIDFKELLRLSKAKLKEHEETIEEYKKNITAAKEELEILVQKTKEKIAGLKEAAQNTEEGYKAQQKAIVENNATRAVTNITYDSAGRTSLSDNENYVTGEKYQEKTENFNSLGQAVRTISTSVDAQGKSTTTGSLLSYDAHGRVNKTNARIDETVNGVTHTYWVDTVITGFDSHGRMRSYQRTTHGDTRKPDLTVRETGAVTYDHAGRMITDDKIVRESGGGLDHTYHSSWEANEFDAWDRVVDYTEVISHDSGAPDKTVTSITHNLFDVAGRVVMSSADVSERGGELNKDYTVTTINTGFNAWGDAATAIRTTENSDGKITIETIHNQYTPDGVLAAYNTEYIETDTENSFFKKYSVTNNDIEYNSVGQITDQRINTHDDIADPDKETTTVTSHITYDKHGRRASYCESFSDSSAPDKSESKWVTDIDYNALGQRQSFNEFKSNGITRRVSYVGYDSRGRMNYSKEVRTWEETGGGEIDGLDSGWKNASATVIQEFIYNNADQIIWSSVTANGSGSNADLTISGGNNGFGKGSWNGSTLTLKSVKSDYTYDRHGRVQGYTQTATQYTKEQKAKKKRKKWYKSKKVHNYEEVNLVTTTTEVVIDKYDSCGRASETTTSYRQSNGNNGTSHEYNIVYDNQGNKVSSTVDSTSYVATSAYRSTIQSIKKYAYIYDTHGNRIRTDTTKEILNETSTATGKSKNFFVTDIGRVCVAVVAVVGTMLGGWGILVIALAAGISTHGAGGSLTDAFRIFAISVAAAYVGSAIGGMVKGFATSGLSMAGGAVAGVRSIFTAGANWSWTTLAIGTVMSLASDHVSEKISDRSGAITASFWGAAINALGGTVTKQKGRLVVNDLIGIAAVKNASVSAFTTQQTIDHRRSDGTVSSWVSGSFQIVSSAMKNILSVSAQETIAGDDQQTGMELVSQEERISFSRKAKQFFKNIWSGLVSFLQDFSVKIFGIELKKRHIPDAVPPGGLEPGNMFKGRNGLQYRMIGSAGEGIQFELFPEQESTVVINGRQYEIAIDKNGQLAKSFDCEVSLNDTVCTMRVESINAQSPHALLLNGAAHVDSAKPLIITIKRETARISEEYMPVEDTPKGKTIARVRQDEKTNSWIFEQGQVALAVAAGAEKGGGLSIRSVTPVFGDGSILTITGWTDLASAGIPMRFRTGMIMMEEGSIAWIAAGSIFYFNNNLFYKSRNNEILPVTSIQDNSFVAAYEGKTLADGSGDLFLEGAEFEGSIGKNGTAWLNTSGSNLQPVTKTVMAELRHAGKDVISRGSEINAYLDDMENLHLSGKLTGDFYLNLAGIKPEAQKTAALTGEIPRSYQEQEGFLSSFQLVKAGADGSHAYAKGDIFLNDDYLHAFGNNCAFSIKDTAIKINFANKTYVKGSARDDGLFVIANGAINPADGAYAYTKDMIEIYEQVRTQEGIYAFPAAKITVNTKGGLTAVDEAGHRLKAEVVSDDQGNLTVKTETLSSRDVSINLPREVVSSFKAQGLTSSLSAGKPEDKSPDVLSIMIPGYALLAKAAGLLPEKKIFPELSISGESMRAAERIIEATYKQVAGTAARLIGVVSFGLSKATGFDYLASKLAGRRIKPLERSSARAFDIGEQLLKDGKHIQAKVDQAPWHMDESGEIAKGLIPAFNAILPSLALFSSGMVLASKDVSEYRGMGIMDRIFYPAAAFTWEPIRGGIEKIKESGYAFKQGEIGIGVSDIAVGSVSVLGVFMGARHVIKTGSVSFMSSRMRMRVANFPSSGGVLRWRYMSQGRIKTYRVRITEPKILAARKYVSPTLGIKSSHYAAARRVKINPKTLIKDAQNAGIKLKMNVSETSTLLKLGKGKTFYEMLHNSCALLNKNQINALRQIVNKSASKELAEFSTLRGNYIKDLRGNGYRHGTRILAEKYAGKRLHSDKAAGISRLRMFEEASTLAGDGKTVFFKQARTMLEKAKNLTQYMRDVKALAIKNGMNVRKVARVIAGNEKAFDILDNYAAMRAREVDSATLNIAPREWKIGTDGKLYAELKVKVEGAGGGLNEFTFNLSEDFIKSGKGKVGGDFAVFIRTIKQGGKTYKQMEVGINKLYNYIRKAGGKFERLQDQLQKIDDTIGRTDKTDIKTFSSLIKQRAKIQRGIAAEMGNAIDNIDGYLRRSSDKPNFIQEHKIINEKIRRYCAQRAEQTEQGINKNVRDVIRNWGKDTQGVSKIGDIEKIFVKFNKKLDTYRSNIKNKFTSDFHTSATTLARFLSDDAVVKIKEILAEAGTDPKKLIKSSTKIADILKPLGPHHEILIQHIRNGIKAEFVDGTRFFGKTPGAILPTAETWIAYKDLGRKLLNQDFYTGNAYGAFLISTEHLIGSIFNVLEKGDPSVQPARGYSGTQYLIIERE